MKFYKSHIKKITYIMVIVGVCIIGLQLRKQTGSYEVAEVFDGDTIAVNMEGVTEKIRFIGIDTPETKDPRKPIQCYGPEASAFTHTRLTHARVKLVSDPLSANRDRYNRLLRYVYLTDGTSYNKLLLSSGFARAYTGFPFSKMKEFTAAESLAKQNTKGLWKTCA